MVSCKYHRTAVVTKNGYVYFRMNVNEPYVQIAPDNFNNERIQMVSIDTHCIALSKDGNVFTWGNNRWLQLGYKTTRPDGDIFWSKTTVPAMLDPQNFGNVPVKFVSAGFDVSAAITKNNDLYLWGFIVRNGEIGPKKFENFQVSYVFSGERDFYLVSLDGKIWDLKSRWDDDATDVFSRLENVYDRNYEPLNDVCFATANDRRYNGHFAVLLNDGTLLTCGNNNKFQLGHSQYDSEKNKEKLFCEFPMPVTEFVPMRRKQKIKQVGRPDAIDQETRAVVRQGLRKSEKNKSLFALLPPETLKHVIDMGEHKTAVQILVGYMKRKTTTDMT